jgi:Ca-activated chloride channel homolog
VKATVLVLALLASSAQASSWWLTPDQEGQRALKNGDPNRAARLFTDPQRRAYAQIEARQYADAARNLAPLNDAESQYNRGNALAHTGDLSSALSAYDNALKRAPADSSLHRDAQHNRDLVAKQLKAQEKQQGAGGQGGKGGQQDQKAGQQKQGGGEQNQGAGQQNQGAGQQNQGAGQQGADQQAQNRSPPKVGDSPQSSASNAGASDRSGGSQAQSAQPPAAQPGASAPDSADQARRDVEAALDRARAPNAQGSENQDRLGQAQNQAGDNAPPAARGSTLKGSEPQPSGPRASPPSEQALSTDQWLRQIPDDPAGLLRRKFLIEHMIKQGTQP